MLKLNRIKQENYNPKVITTMWEDFAWFRNKAEFTKEWKDILAHSPRNFSNKKIDMSADLHTLFAGNTLIGFVINRYYKPVVLKDVVHYSAIYTGKRLSGLNPTTFDKLLKPFERNRSICELAFYWVNPSWRGKGIGKKLFNYSLKRAKQVLKRDYMLTMVVTGDFLGSKVGTRLYEFINNTPISAVTPQLFKLITGRNIADVKPRLESLATKHMAESVGYRFVGYSRNLHLLYVNTPKY